MLIGSWEAKDEAGEKLTLTFEEKDQLTIKFSGSSGKDNYSSTKSAQYHISLPNHLDLIFGKNQTIQTIFKITPEGKLLIPLIGLTYQTRRPIQFNPVQVREFTRVEQANSSK